MNLTDLAKLFTAGAVAMEVGFSEVMEECARVVEKEAKSIFGNYQTGIAPLRDWAPLADATVAEKTREGYAPPDNPLLRTGTTRKSLEHSANGHAAHIGSDWDVMLWQEMGTTGQHPIPPRSVLGAAAIKKGPEIRNLIWGANLAVLSGGRHRDINLK